MRAQPLPADMHPVAQPGTAAGASVAAAEAPVSVVCHIRPLSVREAADAAPDVLAVHLKPSNRPGKPADALVESGGASYAFDHGAAISLFSHVVRTALQLALSAQREQRRRTDHDRLCAPPCAVFGGTGGKQSASMYELVVAPLVAGLFEGVSGTVFAYGQTGKLLCHSCCPLHLP